MSATFGPGTWAFLERIGTDNSKATFDSLREDYRTEVAEPSAVYVEAMAELLPRRVHPGLRGEAKVGRSLFRINRDLRFAKDTAPYKDHLDFVFWVGDGPPREQPACIVRLTADAVLLGAGQMGLRGPRLERYRSRLDDEVDGSAIRAIVESLTADGATLSEPSRKKPPRPLPVEHPNAELLRRDGFHLTVTHPHPSSIDTGAFPGWCADRLAPFRGLLDWLTD